MFVPNYYFDNVFDVTPELLLSYGIKGVILDIDNTLVPYEIPEPTVEIRAWLESMWAMGIKTAFVSNNNADRVNVFNLTLGCPAFPDSGKPLKKSCKKALDVMGVSSSQAAIIGDQVFTDVLAGWNSRLKLSILVKPIKDKTSFFFRFKRFLEKPVIWKYKRKNKK